MKIAFLLLVIVHGLIHLLGFIKAVDWVQIKDFPIEVSKGTGYLWLTAALFFLIFALSYFLEWKYSWYIGLAAVLVSQVLIIMYWKEAKFGSVPNLIILILTLITWMNTRFDAKVEKELGLLFASQTNEKAMPHASMDALPAAVQLWLKNSGASAQTGPQKVRVDQAFQLKLKPEQNDWYRGKAVQYFNPVRPGFLWYLDLNILAWVNVRARDLYLDGKGEMLIKLWSLFPVVNEKNNPKIDEGTLQRFLGEMVWFPWMAKSPYITWESAGENKAEAYIQFQGVEASGTFTFDQEGKFRQFQTERFMGGDENAKRYPWIITAQSHTIHQGIEIPILCEASWILDDGPWKWAIIEILSVDYEGG